MTDNLIEQIACAVERTSLLDLRGSMASKKGDREDAAIRRQARDEQKEEIAGLIRSFKSDGGNSLLTLLSRINEEGDRHGSRTLVSAWPLTWLGLCDVTMTMKLNQNSLPPEVGFSIHLTEKGKARLDVERRAIAGEIPEQNKAED